MFSSIISLLARQLFQEAQHSKKLASEAFERDQVASARTHLADAKSHLRRALALAPVEVEGDLEKEIATVDRMTEMASENSTEFMSKLTRSSYHAMNRKRGRAAESGIDDAEAS